MIRLMIFCCMLCLPNLVFANWFEIPPDDNPFTKLGRGAMVGNSAGQAVGFRCTDGKASILFLTGEALSVEVAEMMQAANSAKPLLRVVIDDDPIVELPALLVVVPVQNQRLLRGDSLDPKIAELMARISTAKRRVAIALIMLGDIVGTGTFPINGARKVLQPIAAGCKFGG